MMVTVDLFDCEMLRGGWPAQPANTFSAVAFLVVAAWLWRRGRRGVASVVAAAGGGSIWFHGWPGGAADWIHDVALYALLAVAAIEVWRAVAERKPPVLAGAVFAVGLVLWLFGRTGGPLCNADALLQAHAAWHVMAASAAGVLFSRPSSTPLHEIEPPPR